VVAKASPIISEEGGADVEVEVAVEVEDDVEEDSEVRDEDEEDEEDEEERIDIAFVLSVPSLLPILLSLSSLSFSTVIFFLSLFFSLLFTATLLETWNSIPEGTESASNTMPFSLFE
jgi:hypothetical protein